MENANNEAQERKHLAEPVRAEQAVRLTGPLAQLGDMVRHLIFKCGSNGAAFRRSRSHPGIGRFDPTATLAVRVRGVRYLIRQRTFRP